MVLADKLKEALLQEAVEGKLTNQEETDSDVNEFLTLIYRKKTGDNSYKKKNTLNHDGKELFDIPSCWQWEKTGNLFNVTTGMTPLKSKKEYYENGTIPWITSSLTKYDYIEKTDEYVTDLAIRETSLKIFPPKTLVIAMYGQGKTRGQISEMAVHATTNQACAVLENIIENETFVKYVKLFYKFNYMNIRKKAGGTAQPNLNLTIIKDTYIPIPPLEEQQRIVDRVNELMEQIDEYAKIDRQLITLKESFPSDLRSAILQAAMQGKLTKQLNTDSNVDELISVIIKEREGLLEDGVIEKPIKTPEINEKEIPFEIPDTWRWVRWGMLSNSIQYGYNAPAQPNGDALMVRISDISNNEIVWENVPYCMIDEDMKKKYQLFENDLLFARTGGTVGKSVLAQNVPDRTVFAGYLIRSNYNTRLNPQYLKYFMESELYWRQLRNGTTQTAQPNCNGKTLSKMMIPLPPVEEQQRIVERLNALLPICGELIDGN